MKRTTGTISIRFTPAEKRRITVFVRKSRLTPLAYIKYAALSDRLESPHANLVRLEKVAAMLLTAVQNEFGFRVGHGCR